MAYNSLQKQQNFGPDEIESICRCQLKREYDIETCLWKGVKHYRKRRKCRQAAFSPFPVVFSLLGS